MPTTIDHFDALTSAGMKIIPLRQNSKIPMCKGWTQNWDRKEAREKLEVYPDSNIGILLGDVIDVEGDSEHANHLLADLIGSYPHPQYRSVRSVHHLFKTPDQSLRHFQVGDIEFRGHGHQSVMPPSSTYGFQYYWLPNYEFPIPPMPERLYIFYLKHKKGVERLLKPGHLRAWCARCGKECFLHKKRFTLEVEAFRLLGSKWECQSCRVVDLRTACRLIRRGVVGHKVISNGLQQF
jgi:hypothetical protein